jgi:mRNA interferase MazF
MKEGDVLLASLLQADGRLKHRPVVALRRMPPFGDWLVCGVSTQLQQEAAGFDVIIQPGETDFGASGLKAASVIRLGFLAVIPETNLLGAIGSISKERHRALLRRLSTHLVPGK